jgi:hypothetical protein
VYAKAFWMEPVSTNASSGTLTVSCSSLVPATVVTMNLAMYTVSGSKAIVLVRSMLMPGVSVNSWTPDVLWLVSVTEGLTVIPPA